MVTEKQNRIYYLQDNVKLYVAESVCGKLLRLGWITIPYLPYSPELASTCYYLFLSLSLSDHFREKDFGDENDLKIHTANFFDKNLGTSTNARSYVCQSVGDTS